jgi:small conductance mechanosensitive channel
MTSTSLLLAQAAPAAAVNVPVLPETALIRADRTIAQRVADATGLPPEVAIWGMNILVAIGILIVGYLGAGLIRNLIRRLLARRHIDQTIGDFAGNIGHAAVITFVVITALGQVGIDTKPFAAVIAAAGLAIGLALQGGLSNFASGFLIVLFRPFRTGDVINGAGIEGTVEEVQIFSTTLHTPDNKKIIVPNSSIMNGTITNYTANNTRRLDIAIAVGAGQDLARAHQVLLQTVTSDSRVLKNPAPDTANLKLVDGGTLVEVHAWCPTAIYGAVASDLIAAVPAAIAQAGIKGPEKSVVFVERRG